MVSYFINNCRHHGGQLSEYVLDPNNVMTDPWTSLVFLEGIEDGKQHVLNNLNKKLTKNLAAVHLYWKSPIAVTITKSNRLKIGDVLANVGGTLGFFMGISIISICEVLFFAFGICASLVQYKRKSHKLTHKK